MYIPMDNRQFKKPYKKKFVSRKEYNHFKTLGAIPLPPVPVFPKSLNVYTQILTQTAENCTAYSAVGERGAVTKKQYDPNEQWKNELKQIGATDAPNGIELDDKMQTGINIGFTPIGSVQPTDKALSYLWITEAPGLDWFDSVRTVILQNWQKYGHIIPPTIGVNWYREWDNTPSGILTSIAVDLLGGHDIEIAGFETFSDGREYVDLQGTWGTSFGDNGIFRVSREVFNSFFRGYGAAYWSDDASLPIAKENALIALFKNVIIAIQRLFQNTVSFPPPPTVAQWAEAVALAEGADPKLNNPGDLKLTTLTKSWGATIGFAAKDGGIISAFPNPAMGMTALINFLQLGVDNELLAFHQARTLGSFMKVFAGNPPQQYLNKIYNQLKVASNFNVSNFVS